MDKIIVSGMAVSAFVLAACILLVYLDYPSGGVIAAYILLPANILLGVIALARKR